MIHSSFVRECVIFICPFHIKLYCICVGVVRLVAVSGAGMGTRAGSASHHRDFPRKGAHKRSRKVNEGGGEGGD